MEPMFCIVREHISLLLRPEGKAKNCFLLFSFCYVECSGNLIMSPLKRVDNFVKFEQLYIYANESNIYIGAPIMVHG